MQLTFYRKTREKIEIKSRYDLIRANGGTKYFNLLVYLGNFQLGHLDMRFRLNNVGKDLCVISCAGLGDLFTLSFEMDKFISFIGREDISFEEFVNASLAMKDACIIKSDVRDREASAYEKLKKRVEKVRDNYDKIVNFCERTKPFGKYYSMPIFLLYNKKEW